MKEVPGLKVLRSTPKVIIGVDPHYAKPLSFTVLRGEEIVAQSKGDIRTLDILLEAYHPDLVAVEDQYLNKNYNTAKKLAWVAGKVMGLCELRKIRCESVNVSTWKACFRVLRGGHEDVSKVLGGIPDDDLASSHLIAAWARDNL